MHPRDFDDAALRAAMRAYLLACDAVASAPDDAQVLERAEAKAVAGMQLRKRLVELGWTAPAAHRAPQA